MSNKVHRCEADVNRNIKRRTLERVRGEGRAVSKGETGGRGVVVLVAGDKGEEEGYIVVHACEKMREEGN